MLAALKSRFDRRGRLDDAPEMIDEETGLPPLPPVDGDEEPFVLRVCDRGEVCFEQPFAAGEIVIGASPECDVVITDIDAPEAATLRLEHIGSACLLTLTALAGGVVARGRELPVGHPLVFTERAVFSLAEDYEFQAFFAPAKTPVAAPGSTPVLLICGAVLLAAAAWSLGQAPPRPEAPVAPAPVVADVTSVDEATIRRPTINDVESPAARIALAEADLRARLVSGNLIPPLRVGARGTTLLVAGAVTADERERLVSVLEPFRERIDVPIEMSLESEPRSAPFFTAVVLEPEAFVIGADGRRYRIDQRLPDGGVIETIDENSIVVNRNGLRERVNYAR
ncbi:MAG TPA: hypothetical protein VLQ65_12545 [Saliniramus sp.]|nr:hypothetical protein [Saliniramus sp.]